MMHVHDPLSMLFSILVFPSVFLQVACTDMKQ